jgi:hypothetical protein
LSPRRSAWSATGAWGSEAVERFRPELIGPGGRPYSTDGSEKPSGIGPYIQGRDKITLHAWLAKVENILVTVFGRNSAHFRQYESLTERTPEHSYEVFSLIGLLQGARDDLQSGFLEGQEQLVAGVVLDSILEQARHLAAAGFKDASAVLGRVVLEDALRRLARRHGCDDTLKPSAINDALRDQAVYSKPQWRAIQSWLDVGNAAAHGEFAAYTAEDVKRLLSDVGQFAVVAYET